jgi:uncharacterized protein (DUF433 family)
MATLTFDDLISVDPERLGGEPVFKGTRVPIRSLFDHLKAGDGLDVFLDDFPGVTREHAQAVLDLAEHGLLNDVRAA